MTKEEIRTVLETYFKHTEIECIECADFDDDPKKIDRICEQTKQIMETEND